MFGFPIFVILSSRYVAIQQRQILTKIKTIVGNKKFQLQELSHFFYFNRKLLSINDTIKEYSRFWSPYLTIALPSLIVILTYEIFFLANDNGIPTFLKYFFFLSVFNLTLFLYLLIKECARVVKFNGKCLVENRKFFLKYIKCKTNSKRAIDLLKVPYNITSYKIYFFCF